MGNKESLIFVYMLNCAICILFFIIGAVMYSASKPAIEVADQMRHGIETVPDDIWYHVQLEEYLE